MKSLKEFIQEGFKFGKNKMSTDPQFSDEELLKDYEGVNYCFTKKEKQVFADKYGVTDIKIRPIQIAILDLLRENRKNKTKFNQKDFNNFHKYGFESVKKFKEYFEQESPEFIEYLYDIYKGKADLIKTRMSRSMSDRYTLKKYEALKNYLNIN